MCNICLGETNYHNLLFGHIYNTNLIYNLTFICYKWEKIEREKRLPQINVTTWDEYWRLFLYEESHWHEMLVRWLWDESEKHSTNHRNQVGENILKSQSMQWKNEWKVISWKRQTAMRLPLLSTAASAAIREITLRACFGPINLLVYYLDFTLTFG